MQRRQAVNLLEEAFLVGDHGQQEHMRDHRDRLPVRDLRTVERDRHAQRGEDAQGGGARGLELILVHAQGCREDRPAHTPPLGQVTPIAIERHCARRGFDARVVAPCEDDLLPEVEPAPLGLIALAVALGEQGVGVCEILEPVRVVVLDDEDSLWRCPVFRQRHRDDLRRRVEAVRDQLEDDELLAPAFEHLGEALPVNLEPLGRNGHDSTSSSFTATTCS